MKFDRSTEDFGNIVHLEHVNVTQPDQRLATLFYVAGLGGTRDPYLMVGTENMWVNFGRSQMHLPTREAQRLRGTIGLVVPDLELLKKRLTRVARGLAGTSFSFEDRGDHVTATCPWGNRFRCHAPSPQYGDTELGMPYVEFDVPSGSAEGIARFYSEIIGAPAEVKGAGGVPTASVVAGRDQRLLFRETGEALPAYDGHHFQVYIADFSGPYERLAGRGLISRETDAHEWRFVEIVDPGTNRPLFSIEHEVRSLKHPLFGRPLVNRNPAQSNTAYVRGQDEFRGSY